MNESGTSKWGTLVTCSLSTFVAWLDFAIVNTALPAIQQDLSTSIAELQWVINSFTLAITVLIVTIGRLSDHLGRKIINILGVSCFGLFSLCAGLSQSPTWLIIFRFLQGASAAAIVPSALALISHAFPGAEKGKALGMWSAINGIGMAVGPAVGGFFVSALSWRWIFFINVPISILSVILSFLFVTESRLEKGAQKIDLKGFLLFTVGLTALIFALMHAPDWGWADKKSLLIEAAAIGFLVWFYLSERHSPNPIIPFSLLLTRSFLSPTLVMFGLNFVLASAIFLIPLYLIQIRGQAAYAAGLMILPITACIGLFSLFSGHLMAKISGKKLMFFGLILYCASTALQGFFSTDSSIYFLLASFILLGIGWGIARTPATTQALSSAPQHFAGTASGVLWSVQNMGGALSIAIILTLFRKIFEAGSTPESFMAGFRIAMWVLTGVSLASLICLLMNAKTSKNT